MNRVIIQRSLSVLAAVPHEINRSTTRERETSEKKKEK
jgi:hypothetical protein